MDDHSKTFSYIDTEGAKIGPVELDEIRVKVEKGELDEDVSIHPKGSKCWVSYKQYVKLNRMNCERQEEEVDESVIPLAGSKACGSISIAFFLLGFIVSAFSFTAMPLLWGVIGGLSWIILGWVVRGLSIDAAKRSQNMTRAVSQLSKTEKTSQMILELQLKRIEELERQLSSLTQGK